MDSIYEKVEHESADLVADYFVAGHSVEKLSAQLGFEPDTVQHMLSCIYFDEGRIDEAERLARQAMVKYPGRRCTVFCCAACWRARATRSRDFLTRAYAGRSFTRAKRAQCPIGRLNSTPIRRKRFGSAFCAIISAIRFSVRSSSFPCSIA